MNDDTSYTYEDVDRPTFNYVVPAKIGDDESLTDACRMTFQKLTNFFNRDGFAICSDAWLAKKRQKSLRTVQRHLDDLEKAGYIYRQTVQCGLKKYRRIWLASEYALAALRNNDLDEDFKKSLRMHRSEHYEKKQVADEDLKKCLRHDTDDSIDMPRMSVSTCHERQINKQVPNKQAKNIKEQTTCAREPEALKVERVKPVTEFIEEHEDFAMMEPSPLLSFFLEIKGRMKKEDQIRCWRFFESERAKMEKAGNVMTNPKGWLRSAIKGRWWEPLSKEKKQLFDENSALAMELFLDFPELQKKITRGYKYLDFNVSGLYYLYESPKFKPLVKKQLEKMGYKVSW